VYYNLGNELQFHDGTDGPEEHIFIEGVLNERASSTENTG
jgi:hypothetical protein